MRRWIVSAPLLLAGCLMLWVDQAIGAVSASLSEQVIDELETVRLTIRASQTRKTETLDLTALDTDFHVMGTNTSSQYSFRNGRERAWVDYQITLQPKRTGDLTIPSIQVGQDQTPTITLTVRPLTDETRQLIDQLVFFEQELSAESVYVQAQLLVKRRLLYSSGVQLYSDLPGAPDISNAVVIALGDPVSSTTERDGRSYGVVEQNYAIFPERSGTLSIPSISLTASVRLINNGRVTRKGVRVGTEVVTVNVQPVPASYPTDQPWIPATDVQLHQVLTPDITEYKVGDTINHELLVYVQGNLGSIAPPVPLALEPTVFRVYPQSPVIDDDPQRLGVVGSRLQTASVLPLRNGRHALPEVSITWWDTAADTLRTTRWAEQKVNIVGEPVPTAPAVTDDEFRAAAAQLPIEETPVLPTEFNINRDWLIWIAAGFAASLFIYWVARFLRRLSPTRRRMTRGQRKRLVNAKLKAMDCGKPHQALSLLDEALVLQSGSTDELSSFQARMQFLHAVPEAAPHMQLLNKAAYAQHPTTIGPETLEALSRMVQAYGTSTTTRAPDLPALYPHQQLT